MPIPACGLPKQKINDLKMNNNGEINKNSQYNNTTRLSKELNYYINRTVQHFIGQVTIFDHLHIL